MWSVRVRNRMRRVGQNLKADFRQGNWKDSKLCVRTGNLRMHRAWACDVYDTQQYVERARSCTHVKRVMQTIIKANSEAMVRDC